MTADASTARHRRLRIVAGDVGRLLAAWAGSTFSLVVVDALLPGLDESFWALAAVAAVAGAAGLVLRPLFVELAARIGWVAIIIVALVGQAVIIQVALTIVTGSSVDFWTAVVASWISAAVGTLISWAATSGTDDGLIAHLARIQKRHPVPVEDPDVAGVVFVQLDGVPFPVLRWAIQSGAVPTIRRWLTAGGYELRPWTVQLPCTTPASQLGLLHGTIDRIPAFRWYDRELGRVLVANRPADARIIEARASTGQGLLSDGGASISNLFSGDAPRAMLTMSRIAASRGSEQTRRAMAWFLASPAGFARSLTRTLAEMAKERWQARRQVRRGLYPTVHRGWTFALMRAVTNGVLRDLNTALVAEEMRRGTRSIYVDYVDYDEIAHHAGMFRPESLASLDGLDRTLASLEILAEAAGRRYRLVVLSDHGQSQGATFLGRHGRDLASVCEELMAQEVQSVDAPVEGAGRAGSVVGDVAGSGGVTGRMADALDGRISTQAGPDPDGTEPAVVLGSGNLALLYLRSPQRLPLEDLERRWPDLVPGLLAYPSVGFVAGLDSAGVPWVVGRDGRRDLVTGAVQGVDPLAAFRDHAGRRLARTVCLTEAPDLYVNSSVDPDTLDVSGFEELVGVHGGLGGWQDRAVLLAPADLMALAPARIEGADELHQVLVEMLVACGQRSGDPERRHADGLDRAG
jgi:uncharacterized membrane protein YvlD (DUF360 family)